ncbi:MAG: ABC transporter permease [Microscillaceae bacterium]|jgi:putative ABC transport system permease protein|nr:ABC transporter permease [Microscillaceae bacterium]
MFRNYLKITWRNLTRHKVYTFINLFGLTIGLTCAILLFLYVRDELTFDSHYKNYQKLYRATAHFKFKDRDDYPATTPGLLAGVLKKDYPEVAQVTRTAWLGGKTFLTYQPENKRLYAREVAYADSNYFQLFDPIFLAGNPKKALEKPYSLVLTKSLAQKFFKNPADALGKVLLVNDNRENYEVTAVVDDLPLNDSFGYNALVSMNSLPKQNFLSSWGNMACNTFVCLKEGADYQAVDKKMQAIFKKYAARELGGFEIVGTFHLQPFKDIHLGSRQLNFDTDRNGQWEYVYIFAVIAVFLVAIASINYMNLATARSVGRAKEVGIRKVLGSIRSQLMGQFLLESIILTWVALVLALSLVELLLPYFNQLAGKSIKINYLKTPELLLAFVSITTLVGLISGMYPAFFLSNFQPVKVLKGKFTTHRQTAFLRKALVIVQFAISIIMIIGTWIVYQQLTFVHNQDLGFDKEQVLVVEIAGDAQTKVDLLKQKIKQITNVKNVASVNGSIGSRDFNVNGYLIEKDGQMSETLVYSILADYDFLPTLGIQLRAGRNFSREFPADSTKAVLVNESLAKKMGWQEALGKRVLNPNQAGDLDSLRRTPGASAKVVGLLRDFHIISLHQIIEPLVVSLTSNQQFLRPNRLFVRLQTNEVKNTLQAIQTAYGEVEKKRPFESSFLDQNFAAQYEKDHKRMTIFFIFSILTIAIACLGLFGLASFMVEQKTKEIGIRKVLGASVGSILVLLSRQFLWLVLWANVLAIPIAAFVMNDWLQDFAYRTNIWSNWFVFICAGAIAVLIALATVGFQVFKSALTNPVEVLKDE